MAFLVTFGCWLVIDLGALALRLVSHGQAQALAHFAPLAVVALAQAAHDVRDGAVLEAVGRSPAFEGVALLAQAVLDLVGAGLLRCFRRKDRWTRCRRNWLRCGKWRCWVCCRFCGGVCGPALALANMRGKPLRAQDGQGAAGREQNAKLNGHGAFFGVDG